MLSISKITDSARELCNSFPAGYNLNNQIKTFGAGCNSRSVVQPTSRSFTFAQDDKVSMTRCDSEADSYSLDKRRS